MKHVFRDLFKCVITLKIRYKKSNHRFHEFWGFNLSQKSTFDSLFWICFFKTVKTIGITMGVYFSWIPYWRSSMLFSICHVTENIPHYLIKLINLNFSIFDGWLINEINDRNEEDGGSWKAATRMSQESGQSSSEPTELYNNLNNLCIHEIILR